MKRLILVAIAFATISAVLPVSASPLKNSTIQTDSSSGYANVNGIKMYYEIHGQGSPLLLIHGGGSTLRTTFGNVLNDFASHHQVIAVEMQGHGHTVGRPGNTTFEQDADDIAALLKALNIPQADIIGFSNGGSTTMQVAIRHPEVVRSVVIISAFYKREGLPAAFWKNMEQADFSYMPQVYKDAFMAIRHDQKALLAMFNQDRERVVHFKDWSDDDIRSIKVPAFVITSELDIVQPEHAIAMSRLLPKGRLAIMPGTHGEFLGEVLGKQDSKMPQLAVAMIEEFLTGVSNNK
ncbi:alpha/beta fold hydrolase [Chitinophaga flava]|uniref:Alpha/beta hydrolase n=1 Tax=Chitinophaga flava TaxID=2259036 RepID=A0A365XXY9_9BACT|nr:alpha/beta hydrolase [Chitinophaga flava]RBL91212.1 alpha/beta hydrolase [Chitinophaga flava]